jgi:hypothetical protein
MLSLSSLECTCIKFSKQPRENLGIEKMVPQTECKAKIGYIRYDNQCNANRPSIGETTPILGESTPPQGVNGLILSDPTLVYS